MWDERYAGESFAYGKEPNDFLKNHAAQLPIGNTLCIGEGEGRNAAYLASLGHQVTALDASSVGLQKAKSLAEEKHVEIQTIHADLNDYVFDAEAWDTVVAIFCHLPPELRKQVHQSVVKTLRPGGMFILEAYTPEQLDYGTGGPPVKAMMMDLVTLRDELDGLRFIHAEESVREIIEGEHHTGMGAVVQVIGQK
jgi:SAM-dependent methyltransferase